MTVATTEPTHGSALALSADQDYWNDKQLAALRHMGVENAHGGDLAVFHHVCQRTGLDPFARQIHMIGRNSKNQRTNEWETKYTIQTGIDGFRLIGRRAADRAHETISVEAPQWAHEDGSWRDVWMPKWGLPIAARVLLRRNGEPFTAVALFDEYKQTKRDGGLTSMWAQRPAGQLAKCAEALAWRMAFPQDLSGIYADEEMGQADRPERHEVPAVGGSAADRMGAVLGTVVPPDEPDSEPVDESAPDSVTSSQIKKLGASMRDAGLTDRSAALAYVAKIIGREVGSRNELTKDEASRVIDALERGVPAGGPAADPEAVWAEIEQVAAEKHGWDNAGVAHDFHDTVGLIPDEATIEQLRSYLHTLVTGEEPSA